MTMLMKRSLCLFVFLLFVALVCLNNVVTGQAQQPLVRLSAPQQRFFDTLDAMRARDKDFINRALKERNDIQIKITQTEGFIAAKKKQQILGEAELNVIGNIITKAGEAFKDEKTKYELMQVLTALKNNIEGDMKNVEAVIANAEAELVQLQQQLKRAEYVIATNQPQINARLTTYQGVEDDLYRLQYLEDSCQQDVKALQNDLGLCQKTVAENQVVYEALVRKGEELLQVLTEQRTVIKECKERQVQSETFIQTYELKCNLRSCRGILNGNPSAPDGVYRIYPGGVRGSGVLTNCEMSSGGWTIIRRRNVGVLDFNQGWSLYESGFGDVNQGEFWLGLQNIYLLTQDGPHGLTVVYNSYGESTNYVAHYSKFQLGSKETKYELQISGFSTTNGAVDSLTMNNQNSFSTIDADNDNWVEGNCAQWYAGPWWYGNCYSKTGVKIASYSKVGACYSSMWDDLRVL
jgi:uncharacterized protein YqgV (UPF0045/DUF77 family)